MTADTERLTHLAALGDQAAAAELERLRVRRSEAPLPAEHYGRQISEALAARDLDTARRATFALYLAYPFLVAWIAGPTEKPLVEYRRRQGPRSDHFSIADDLHSPRVASTATPGRGGLLVPLLWSQAMLDMARRELARFACHHARHLIRSDAFRAAAVADPRLSTLAPIFAANLDPVAIAAKGDPDDILLRIKSIARSLPRICPEGPVCAGVLKCALEVFDPDAPLSRIRASATAVSMYTFNIITNTRAEVAADSKPLHARMLAALYCGCEYSITPKD